MKQALQKGFTLIELLLVIAIISLLMVFLVPKGLEAMEQGKVVSCQKNLTDIYGYFVLWDSRFKNTTKVKLEGGVKYFLRFWEYEVCERSEKSAKTLTCPAVNYSDLPGLQGLELEEWFNEWEVLDGTFTSYAGRDIENYPLRKMTAKEPLVCDDNDGGMNHPHITNVLMGDGSYKTFDLTLLKKDGVLAEEDEILFVGPESPVEMLQKFILD